MFPEAKDPILRLVAQSRHATPEMTAPVDAKQISTGPDYEWRRSLLRSALPNMTLGRIFPPDGLPSTESPALTRIAVMLLFSEHFPGLFGDWSPEENLVSIDPLELLRLSRTSPPKQVRRLNETPPALLRTQVWLLWALLKANVMATFHSAINVLWPLYSPLKRREIRLMRFLPRDSRDLHGRLQCELTNISIDTPPSPFSERGAW
jgi:hypothetical protein